VESGEGIESFILTFTTLKALPRKWNPVKELKAIFYTFYLVNNGATVESGEGIERSPRALQLPQFPGRPVESGEGIERAQDVINRLWQLLKWNPVKELKENLV